LDLPIEEHHNLEGTIWSSFAGLTQTGNNYVTTGWSFLRVGVIFRAQFASRLYLLSSNNKNNKQNP